MMPLRRPGLLGLLAVVLAAGACSWDGLREQTKPNQRPSVRITGGAVNGGDVDYRVEFFWFGSDPDGVVDHFLIAIDDTCLCRYPDTLQVLDPETGTYQTVVQWIEPTDPDDCRARGIEPSYTSVDSIWKRTTGFSATFNFDATSEAPGQSPPYYSSDWHSFYIKAVDDRAGVSLPDKRMFNAITVAPTTRLLAPVGEGPERSRIVSSFVTVRWVGRDEDSTAPDRKPSGYQFKMVQMESIYDPDDFVYAALSHPRIGKRNVLLTDSLVVADSIPVGPDTYHATDWWPKPDRPYREEVLRLESLLQNNYALAVRAVDEAGAITPAQDLLISDETNNGNIVKLDVNEGIPVNPHLTVRETNFLGQKSFIATGESPWRVEVPVNVPLRFEWDADASWYGARVGRVNFALDIADPGCEVCQENSGIGGWIGWGGHRSVPYDIVFTEADAGEQHVLYVRARDESFRPDREILVAVVMDVIAFSFDRTALLVDDFKAAGVNDCDHDAFVVPMIQDAVRPHLEIGEQLHVIARPRINECGEASGRIEIPLSVLSRYKVIYWNVSPAGSGSMLGVVTDPDPQAEQGKYLSIYMNAGGNLIVWGRQTISALLGDFLPQGQGYVPELPLFQSPNFGPGTFVWDVMDFRTMFDRVGRSGERRLGLSCSGIVGMEITDAGRATGLPAGMLDPTGYSTDPANQVVEPTTALWIDGWSGRRNVGGAPGPDVPVGTPPLKVPGLDTLYTFIPNVWSYEEDGPTAVVEVCGTFSGSDFDGQPVIMRYDDPRSSQGRIVWIGTPLHIFAGMHGADLHEMMSGFTDWVFLR